MLPVVSYGYRVFRAAASAGLSSVYLHIDQIDKNQKEYYLREQIKVIQTELGEQDVAAEAESYRARVLDLKLPKECEDKLIREVDRFAKLSGSTAEQGVVRTYLDTVLDVNNRVACEVRPAEEEPYARSFIVSVLNSRRAIPKGKWEIHKRVKTAEVLRAPLPCR